MCCLQTRRLQKICTKQPSAATFPHSKKSMFTLQYPLFMRRSETPSLSPSLCPQPEHAIPAILEADLEKVGFLEQAELTGDRLVQAPRGGLVAWRRHVVPDRGSRQANSSREKVLGGSCLGKHLGTEVQSCFVFFFFLFKWFCHGLAKSCFQICFRGKPWEEENILSGISTWNIITVINLLDFIHSFYSFPLRL